MSEINNEEIKFNIKNRNFTLKKSDFKDDKKEKFLFDYLTNNAYNKFEKSDSKRVSINMLDKEQGTRGTITQNDINIFLQDEKVKKKEITQQDLVKFIDKMFKLNPTADEKVLNHALNYKDETGKTIMTPELKEVFGFERSDVSKKIADVDGKVKKGMEIFDLNNDGKIDTVEKEYQSKSGVGVSSKINHLDKYLNQIDKDSETADGVISKEDKQRAYDKTKSELLTANREKLEKSEIKDEKGNNVISDEIKTQFKNNEKIAFKDVVDENGNVKKGYEVFDLNGDGKLDDKEKGYFSASGHSTDKVGNAVGLAEFLSAMNELDMVGYVKTADNNIKNNTVTAQDKQAIHKILDSGVYML